VTPATHELYRRLLRQSGDRAAANEHAGLYLNLLMTEKQERKALGLLREALDANPDFVPLQPEHGDLLAARAKLGGQAQLALDAWQALLRRQPAHQEAPRWALEAAMLLVERFARDAEARALLEQARARTADAALLERIDAALKALPPA
jgi:tetratricopeptide (TPR) repeat protein